ncbi:MAG: 30S ribosomal protein S20 [Bacteroidales bacterium]|jgi:small subunit ribosomal protein S20|nr:30S ribosomal protein S20 [Bacteroidales bacterium]
MANHKSSIKRIRPNEYRTLEIKYYAKTTRKAIKNLRPTTEKAAAVAQYPEVASMLDKLAKKSVIHKNKASNLKSKLSHYINTLA